MSIRHKQYSYSVATRQRTFDSIVMEGIAIEARFRFEQPAFVMRKAGQRAPAKTGTI
jgi:hypothetical protein